MMRGCILLTCKCGVPKCHVLEISFGKILTSSHVELASLPSICKPCSDGVPWCREGITRIQQQNSILHHRQMRLFLTHPSFQKASPTINPHLFATILPHMTILYPFFPSTAVFVFLMFSSLNLHFFCLPSFHWFLFLSVALFLVHPPPPLSPCRRRVHAEFHFKSGHCLPARLLSFSPSPSVHFTISIASLLSCGCCHSPAPLPPQNLDFPPPAFLLFLLSVSFSSSSHILCSFSLPNLPFSSSFCHFPFYILFSLLYPFPDCSRYLALSLLLSPSLLKMPFSSWSSLTRNHCVSPGVGVMDSEDGGREGCMLPGWKMREREMWASERHERGRARNRRGWKFSPASINHFRERKCGGECVCV